MSRAFHRKLVWFVAALAAVASKLIVAIGCSTGERYLSADLAVDARKEVGI